MNAERGLLGKGSGSAEIARDREESLAMCLESGSESSRGMLDRPWSLCASLYLRLTMKLVFSKQNRSHPTRKCEACMELHICVVEDVLYP